MLKLIKYLKPFTLTVLAIVMLLFIQAICDLSLPDYTSNIVNVGIQQGGIENAVPQAIRKSEMDKIRFFMSQADQTKVLEHYTLLDRDSMSNNMYEENVKDYPKLSEEPIYKLNVSEKSKISELNTIMGKPILIISEMEKNGMGSIDPAKIPAPQIEAVKKIANDKFAQMPESMITQAAVSYVRKEYGILGLNTDKIQTNYILYSGAVMLLIALLSMASTVVVSFLGARVAAGLSKKLRENVFRKVVSFSSSEFDKFSTASLITRSTNDIQQIQMMMVMLLRIVFYAPILGTGGVIKVLSSDYSMGWIIAVAVAAILALVIVLFSVAIPKFKMIQKLVDRLNLVTREILSGILVIRAFNTQKHEEKKFEAANWDLTKTNLFVSRIMSLMMPMMMLIMNGITLLIVWVGAHQVDQGAMQVGNMMAFIQYAMQIIIAFLMISMVSIMLPRATVSAERIGEVLDAEISVKDAERLNHFGLNQKGYVEFKNVSFRYPGAEEDVLSGISFTAKPGQTTAFIGSTGSGKTTLINLIPRFYDATGGEILVDGTDIKTVSQQELREKIGYVPQKAILFSGTIKSNLKYGVEDAAESELNKAAVIAQAIDFIRSKDEGFGANISQGGANVSGGQKQRLSIARALVKKPEIFIFDDSFSALDFKTEAALRKALKAETTDSTILVVAQRISTIMNADQIIVLDEGKIVGKGKHQELMENCEVYQQIALSQLSKEELA
ncbi:MAG: ABC transporter ATP-binding protein [Peptococcaceae bacterium]|nr:ABC transporter ATP-binding protein [Peptococcaceae bacterium]